MSYPKPLSHRLLPTFAAALAGGSVVFLLAGCGGGSGGGGNNGGSGSPSSTPYTPTTPVTPYTPTTPPTTTTTTTTTTAPTTTTTTTTTTPPPINNVDPNTGGSIGILVNWPYRVTRKWHGKLVPVAAQSMHFVVTADGTNGPTTIKDQVVARPPDDPTTPPAPTLLTLDHLPVRSLTLTATACPNADGTGVIQAQGAVMVPLTQNNYDPQIDFRADSTIDHITVGVPQPRFAIGATQTVSVTAYDASGNVVLTLPQTVSLTTADQNIAVFTDSKGALFANSMTGQTTITAQETESGKTTTATVAVGFPLHVAVDASGNDVPIPFTSDPVDDARVAQQTTNYGNGFLQRLSPGAYDWVGAVSALSDFSRSEVR